MLDTLANRAGLEGIGGSGRDLRDIEAAAAEPGTRRPSSPWMSISRPLDTTSGPTSIELGGADAIVFTGGIGENSTLIRNGVCRDLDWFGIDPRPRPPTRAARWSVSSRPPGSRVRGLDRADQRGDSSWPGRSRDLLLNGKNSIEVEPPRRKVRKERRKK